jgi:aspartate/methionine/tyrosine aminotransferase
MTISALRLEGMADRTLLVGSMSKERRMIGWRVGWVAGPADTVADVGWAHVYNTTTPVGVARAAATAVLRGDQGHVADCVAELERRRDTILDGLPRSPIVRPAGGWSLLLDVAALGYVRFVFSAAPVERLATILERLAGGRLGQAIA